MSIFEHHRFEIWNQTQHPYKHEMTDFSYTSSALPGVSTVSGVLDWIVNVLYPIPKAMVATPAALPSVGNTIGDYRVVTDDGDGKSAGYRWEQREGDAVAKWYKIYDMDFGAGSVLQQAMDNAQELFVLKFGNDDLDSAGAAVAGTYAGQVIYGGKSASTNLTLRANAGDGVGANTGFVQVDDHFRPAATTNTLDLGTSAKLWRNIYFGTQLFSPSGTAGSPSIIGTSFSTTGIYWAAGILGVAIAGAAILDISATSNVWRIPSLSIQKSNAGAVNSLTVTNSSDTASAGALIEVVSGGTSSSANAIFRASTTGGEQWAFGVDNGNAGRFSIAHNSNLGSSDFLTITAAGLVTLGAANGGRAHVVNGKSLNLVGASSGSDALSLSLTANSTSNGGVSVGLTNITGATSDTYFTVSDGTGNWAAWGYDKSVNKFALGINSSGSPALGSSDFLQADVTGHVMFASGAPITIGSSTAQSTVALRLTGNSLLNGGSTTQFGIYIDAQASSAATAEYRAIHGEADLASSSFTCALLTSFYANASFSTATATRYVNYYVGANSGTITARAFMADNASFSGDHTLNFTSTNPAVLSGDFKINTAGKGLFIKEGSNAKMGTATLNGVTAVTISTTAVTANSRIMLTTQASGGTVGAPYVDTRSAGTSFNIKSTGAADTSTVAWMIVEPA